MLSIKYRLENGLVVDITEGEITPSDGYGIAYSDSGNLAVGDEIEYRITVTGVNKDGELLSYTSVLQSPSAKELLTRIKVLVNENTNLKTDLGIAQEAIDFLLMNLPI